MGDPLVDNIQVRMPSISLLAESWLRFTIRAANLRASREGFRSLPHQVRM
jgi:hypothetical protein